jgi:hypothetical protein
MLSVIMLNDVVELGRFTTYRIKHNTKVNFGDIPIFRFTPLCSAPKYENRAEVRHLNTQCNDIQHNYAIKKT